MNEFLSLLSRAQTILLMLRLAVTAVAVFLAIVAWTKTRTQETVCFIAGVLCMYLAQLFAFLRAAGFSITRYTPEIGRAHV